jgi:hypothetical protein
METAMPIHNDITDFMRPNSALGMIVMVKEYGFPIGTYAVAGGIASLFYDKFMEPLSKKLAPDKTQRPMSEIWKAMITLCALYFSTVLIFITGFGSYINATASLIFSMYYAIYFLRGAVMRIGHYLESRQELLGLKWYMRMLGVAAFIILLANGVSSACELHRNFQAGMIGLSYAVVASSLVICFLSPRRFVAFSEYMAQLPHSD